MKKTKAWYKGTAGMLAQRSKREASLAGMYNAKLKVVTCIGCGRDTTDKYRLCDKCDQGDVV